MPTSILLLADDYAWGKPKPKDLVGAGFRLTIRYLSPDASKNLTAAERDALLAAGEDIAVVWESTATRATEGATAGAEDGARAVAELKALHGPRGMAIYAAVDGDIDPTRVEAYFRAFRRVLKANGYLTGGYGSIRVVEHLLAIGLIDVGWQTEAWSGGKMSQQAGVKLYQRAQTKKVDGVTVDVDVILRSGYCGWRSAAAVATAAVPKKAAAKKQSAPPVVKKAVKKVAKKAAKKVATAKTGKSHSGAVALSTADVTLLRRVLALLRRLLTLLGLGQ